MTEIKLYTLCLEVSYTNHFSDKATNKFAGFLISSVLKPHVFRHVVSHCHIIKAFKGLYACCARFPWSVNHHQFTDPRIRSILKYEKIDTDVYFTISLNHLPQRQCDKKASTETTRQQSVIMTSQLPVASSCIDDVTISQHFEIIGSSAGIKCWFMSSNPQEWHDRCTEYTGTKMFGRYCSMIARHLGFRGDSEYFSQLYIRSWWYVTCMY